MDDICRLCCSTKFVNNYIFDEENALYLKMSLYLPIKVIVVLIVVMCKGRVVSAVALALTRLLCAGVQKRPAAAESVRPLQLQSQRHLPILQRDYRSSKQVTFRILPLCWLILPAALNFSEIIWALTCAFHDDVV